MSRQGVYLVIATHVVGDVFLTQLEDQFLSKKEQREIRQKGGDRYPYFKNSGLTRGRVHSNRISGSESIGMQTCLLIFKKCLDLFTLFS